MELAAVLGARYRREGESDLSHSNLLTVLDSSGVIVHQQGGLREGVPETISRMRQALE